MQYSWFTLYRYFSSIKPIIKVSEKIFQSIRDETGSLPPLRLPKIRFLDPPAVLPGQVHDESLASLESGHPLTLVLSLFSMWLGTKFMDNEIVN